MRGYRLWLVTEMDPQYALLSSLSLYLDHDLLPMRRGEVITAACQLILLLKLHLPGLKWKMNELCGILPASG